jgi:hypothetical protein
MRRLGLARIRASRVDTHGKRGEETIVDSRTNYESLLDQPVLPNTLRDAI